MADTYTEEEKKVAYEKVAQIKIYQLHLIKEILDIASTRGAFKANEFSHVGSVYDTIKVGIDKAFQYAKEEIAKKEADALVIEKNTST